MTTVIRDIVQKCGSVVTPCWGGIHTSLVISAGSCFVNFACKTTNFVKRFTTWDGLIVGMFLSLLPTLAPDKFLAVAFADAPIL